MEPDRPATLGDFGSLSAQIASSIDGLLTRRSQASSQAIKACRSTFDTAWCWLEQVEAQELGAEEAPKLIEQLTRTVAGHVQLLADQVQADADLRIRAAIAETKRQRHKVATLSERLEEIRAELQVMHNEREADRRQQTAAAAEVERLHAAMAETSDRLKEAEREADRLRFELETERRQASSMILEVGQSRMAAQQANSARAELAVQLQKESRDREALENQLLETKSLFEATLKEATAARQRLRAAVAEAVKLVASADPLDPVDDSTAAVSQSNPEAGRPSVEVRVPEMFVSEPAARAMTENHAKKESTLETSEPERSEAKPESVQLCRRPVGADSSGVSPPSNNVRSAMPILVSVLFSLRSLARSGGTASQAHS